MIDAMIGRVARVISLGEAKIELAPGGQGKKGVAG